MCEKDVGTNFIFSGFIWDIILPTRSVAGKFSIQWCLFFIGCPIPFKYTVFGRWFSLIWITVCCLYLLDYHHCLYWKCLIYNVKIQWHCLLLLTIHEFNVKKTQLNNSFQSILDEDVPFSIVVENVTAEETRDMLKAFAMLFLCFFLYILIYSIWSNRKSLKQHFH